MKKFILLIPAMLLSLAMNADPIGPGDASTTVIGALKTAVDAAAADAVIELSDGIYQEGDVIDLNKDITIKAAEGAHPVIAQKYYFKLLNNAQVIFQGIKFDGGLYPASDHCIRAYDESPTGTLILVDCEFTRYPSYIIYTQSDSRRLDAITIRNCYFHNNTKCAVHLTYSGSHQTCNSLTIENSTFADFTGNENGVIYYGAPDGEHTTTLNVNHCTFYNNLLQAIEWRKSTNLTITNSIFAQPASVEAKAVYCAGGTITNCLSYNSQGYSSAAIPSGNLTGNPYFVNTNPANYDLTTASFSPAHNAGTDSKTLGDYLRWTSDDSAHPTTINISAGTDAIKGAVEAAWPGDQIVLATGIYNESARITVDKNITLKAADEATPTVVPVKDIAISNGANVILRDIKFDCTSLNASRLVYVTDNAANNLTIEGCDIYNTGSNYAVHAGSSAHLDACVINNCYFHNGTNTAVCFAKTSQTYNACDDLTITNSTFANYSGFNAPLIAFSNRNEVTNSPAEADAKLVVDHCTFYNFTKTADNTYGFIDSRQSANTTISNCIMANPTAQDLLPEGKFNPKASQTYGGTVTNCLRYNVPEHRTSPTNPVEADPLFTDAANGDFTLKRNYITGEVSPAYKAGTEGSTIGDPRWETEPTYPETDFYAPDYVFTAANAKLTGSIVFETSESAPTHPYIRYDRSSTPGQAEWVIKATKACYVKATINMVDNKWNAATDASKFQNHKHIFTIELFDSNSTSIGSVTEGPWTEDGYGGEDWYGDVALPGYIYIATPGVYTVKLYNTRNNSRCGVGSVTITYMGGDTQTITNSANFVTDIDDAYFSSNGTRADGKISFSGNAVASEWLRWNVTVANSDYYDITLNSDVESGHIYSVTFYDGETQVARVAESAWHNTTGAIALGRRFLPAGNYVLEIKNSVSSNSDAKIVSVGAVAFVAPVISLPNTLPAASAITSELAYEDGGELYFTPSDQRGHIIEQWAKWKVSVAEAGAFLFTMNVTSTNEQSYKITILDSENTELDSYTKNPGSGAQTIKHYFDLAAGNYFVMVQNTTNHSDGHMVSMVVSQPEMVTIDEAATSTDSWADKVGETTYDVQIIRTIVAGMYNTLCLPFAVSSSQCKEIFGADVQIRTLESATVEEGNFVLNLNFHQASDIYQGTPVLIKTSQNIVNPIFIGVQLATATPATSPGTNADFIGNFVAGTIVANPDHLFMGANNTLYFPTVDTEILGMRGYFYVHDAPAGVIQRARIVEADAPAVTTDINRVEVNASVKTIENGQLVIIRDGKKYNVMGVRMK